MVQADDSYFEIAGVTSFGYGCATNVPGVYASISDKETLDWLKDFMSDHEAATCGRPEPQRKRRRNRLANRRRTFKG